MVRENGNARELAYRESDGLEVSLVWDPSDDALTVVVTDRRTGEEFDFAPDRRRALDAFYHPFAHAIPRGATSWPPTWDSRARGLH
jgi:hypothetical protein